MFNSNYTIDSPDLNLLVANVIAAHARGDIVTITPAAPAAAPETPKEKPAGTPFIGMSNGYRVEIPAGTHLRKIYYDVQLDAEVAEDGRIIWNGIAYDNLTAAATASGLSVNENCNAPNGYHWWKVEEDGKWKRIYDSRFTARTKPARK